MTVVLQLFRFANCSANDFGKVRLVLGRQPEYPLDEKFLITGLCERSQH